MALVIGGLRARLARVQKLLEARQPSRGVGILISEPGETRAEFEERIAKIRDEIGPEGMTIAISKRQFLAIDLSENPATCTPKAA